MNPQGWKTRAKNRQVYQVFTPVKVRFANPGKAPEKGLNPVFKFN